MTKRSERSERLRVVNLVHHHPRGGWGKIWGPDVSRCLLRRGDTIVREVETDTKLSIRQHPRHTTPKDTKNCTHPVRAPFSPVDRNSPIRSSKIIVRTRLIVKLISNTSNFIRSDKLWSSNISTSCEKSLVEKKYKRTFLRFTYLAALLLKIAIVYVAAVISGRVAENQLEIGARRGERDLRITFPATILKAHLAFLDWSVPIAGVSHLCKFRERKEKKKDILPFSSSKREKFDRGSSAWFPSGSIRRKGSKSTERINFRERNEGRVKFEETMIFHCVRTRESSIRIN